MVKKINMALQGGGAHGAFTWGVLDRLLDCEKLEIAGISGTSAGALNGAAFKAGMATGGRDGARANLAWLWARVLGVRDFKIAAWMSPWAPATNTIARSLEATAGWGDLFAQATSPYSFGPFYRNPLDGIVHDMKFDDVCAKDGPELHVCATNVRTGKIRVFTGEDVTPESLMASACLPTVFKAVEIAGEAYWDGGYTGNPALFPLYEPHLPDDIVIVNINPLERDKLPYTAQEIQNRINEISFNSSLLRDLRAIRFVQRLIEDGRLTEGTMSYINVHMIADDELMRELSVATKMVPSAILVERLFAAGRIAADRFIDAHLDDVNVRSSVDLAEMYD
ncbi:Patatin-like phospholipase [Rhodobacteraceae bacterium THAF1]|uniref:patatin-like phospholipase family protein n=1 Tax=Palleronia sp. THAF1 TaxID=2587842 RepID=UPI000F3CE469|nr:patatin-like phospholipase family protein [Palleronia sp. THAF1]QFU08450.1 Patatin-like phospholipase [Palleronia sp. THAF1]VDC29327.1 Patatin-like phospholipase [Rhodobacteraceae bacterium THAF1]